MGCTRLVVVLLTISLVQQLTSAASIAEYHEKAKELYERGKGDRLEKNEEDHDLKTTDSLTARLTQHIRQKLSEMYDSLSPQEIHEKLKTLSPGALELMSDHIKEHYGDVDLHKLHEELKKTSPEQQQEMMTKLAQHIQDQLLNKLNSMSTSELHEKLMSVSPQVSQHIKEKLAEKLSLSQLHEKVKESDPGAGWISGLFKEKLGQHIKADQQFDEMSLAEIHEKLMSAGPEESSEHIKEKLKEKLSLAIEKLREHIKTNRQSTEMSRTELSMESRNPWILPQPVDVLQEKLSKMSLTELHELLAALPMASYHETLRKISPAKPWKLLEEKLGDNMKADTTSMPLAELHEQLRAYSSQISEHIRDKMSELVAKRSATNLQSRSAGDCVSDLRDIVSQAETIMKDQIQVITSYVSAITQVAQCPASTNPGTCLENVLTQFEQTVQNMASGTTKAFTSLAQDYGKLATCLTS